MTTQVNEGFLLEMLRSITVDAIDAGWKAGQMGASHDDALVSLRGAGEEALARMAGTLARQIAPPRAALDRVLAVCDEWDALSKGETATTARIRAAINNGTGEGS